MEYMLFIVCLCLFAISAVLLWKYISLKRNIRHCSNELEKLKNSNYRQPLKVTDFDNDLTELAVKSTNIRTFSVNSALDMNKAKNSLAR